MVAALGLSDDPNLLDAGRIGELFGAVNAGLRGVGLRAPVEVMVVGGAAIAVLWNPGRATYDVDVVSEGIPAVFWGVVAAVGRAEGLDAEWLNAAARVKAPTGPTPGEPTAILSRVASAGVRGESPLRVGYEAVRGPGRGPRGRTRAC